VNTILLTINGQIVKAETGWTVLEAARAAGIYIPTLCYHPDLKPYGGCRLCVVEIDGVRGVPTSCTTPVAQDMIVNTETVAVNKVRKTAVELLIADHPSDCLTCSSNQQCELQKVAAYLGVREIRLPKKIPAYRLDAGNPFFSLDRNKCILCARCTRTCESITCVGAIDMAFRGYNMKVAVMGDGEIVDSICQSCGECVVRCPVGALSPRKSLPPIQETVSTCAYCGVGCSVILGTRGDRIVSVRGNPEGPANSGKLCVKGRYGIEEFVHSPERLTTPLVKKNGRFEKATWNEAIDLIAEKFSCYKPEEIAVISSSRTSNEDNYTAQKFARAVLYTNNVDNCARV
jgi:predicted molibdopterin-dependent oxidoreductase YjgC